MSIIAVPYFMGETTGGFGLAQPHETLEPTLPAANPQHRMAELYRSLACRVAALDRPVVYAGDCVSIIGVLAGLEQRGVRATLVFFDAHGDFNTWNTTPSGFIGGMPLAMVTGRGEQTIVLATGLSPLADSRVVLVDGRDIDPDESIAIAASGIGVARIDSVMDHIPASGPLYVHVDADVVDPRDMPAMNYPVPGGPSLAAVCDTLTALSETKRVVAFSVSAWNPTLPGAEIAAGATWRLAQPFADAAT